MFCNKCGTQNDSNSKFCVKCGNTLDQNINANNNQMNNGVNQTTQYAPIPNNNKKTLTIVLIVVGVLAAIFLIKTIATAILKVNLENIKDKIEDGLEITPDLTDDETDTKRVGLEGFGYVSVPNDWVKFSDVETPGVFQYTSPDGYIVTLMYYEDSAGKSETYATSVYESMEDGGATGVTGARVKVGNIDAFQVYGFYPDKNIWVVTWMLEPGDGHTHYMSLEGPDRYSEHFNIPNTYSLDK